MWKWSTNPASPWWLPALSVLALLLYGTPLSAAGVTFFQPARTSLAEVLSGAWQSCPDGDDGAYGERVFLYKVGKKAIAEIHLGPRSEFGVFAGEVEGERDHKSADNLLGPAFDYDDVPTVQGGRNWSIQSLNLHINIVKVPGSTDECRSFYVLVTPLARRTLAQ